MAFNKNLLSVLLLLTLWINVCFSAVNETVSNETIASTSISGISALPGPTEPPSTTTKPTGTPEPPEPTIKPTSSPKPPEPTIKPTNTPKPSEPTSTPKPSEPTSTPKPSEPTTNGGKSSSIQPPALSTTTQLPKPPKPTTNRKFDFASFVGGGILMAGMLAISFMAFKFYKSRLNGPNYLTL